MCNEMEEMKLFRGDTRGIAVASEVVDDPDCLKRRGIGGSCTVGQMTGRYAPIQAL